MQKTQKPQTKSCKCAAFIKQKASHSHWLKKQLPLLLPLASLADNSSSDSVKLRAIIAILDLLSTAEAKHADSISKNKSIHSRLNRSNSYHRKKVSPPPPPPQPLDRRP
ncbi:MAG: hypothetical protein AB1546_13865, partial [bacterium]